MVEGLLVVMVVVAGRKERRRHCVVMVVVVRVPAIGKKHTGEVSQKSLSLGKAYTDLVKGFW